MREIKFLGKRVDNGEWLFGNIQVPKPPFDKYFMWKSHLQCEVIPETIGQFIGLLDKNGKEIYEGDVIIEYEGGHKAKVIFNESTACFDIEYPSGECDQLCYKTGYTSDIVEVIGNIHDNPELLKS